MWESGWMFFGTSNRTGGIFMAERQQFRQGIELPQGNYQQLYFKE